MDPISWFALYFGIGSIVFYCSYRTFCVIIDEEKGLCGEQRVKMHSNALALCFFMSFLCWPVLIMYVTYRLFKKR